MRFRALACDYDRTIAVHGLVPEETLQSLQGVSASGRELLLVTGRTMDELLAVFQDVGLFRRLVLENGALVHDPATGRDEVLAAPLDARLIDELERRDVRPLVCGRVMCSTTATNTPAVTAAITNLGLDLGVTPNRDSIMVLPRGVDKALGLRAAAAGLGLDLHAVVAVGDGENDLPFLGAAGAAVAVENAVPELKDRADIVLAEPESAGIRALCASLAERDLEDLLESAPVRR